MPDDIKPYESFSLKHLADYYGLTREEALDALRAARDVKKVKESAAKLKQNVFDDSTLSWFSSDTAPESASIRAVIMPLCDACDTPIERRGILLTEPLRSLDGPSKILTKKGQAAYHIACLKKLLDGYAVEQLTGGRSNG